MYRKHKLEMNELQEKLHSGHYESRLKQLVTENQTMSTRLASLSDAQRHFNAMNENNLKLTSSFEKIVAELERKSILLEAELTTAQNSRLSAKEEVSLVQAEFKRIRHEQTLQKQHYEEMKENLDAVSFKYDEAQIELEEATSRLEAATQERDNIICQLHNERQCSVSQHKELQQVTSKCERLSEVRCL